MCPNGILRANFNAIDLKYNSYYKDIIPWLVLNWVKGEGKSFCSHPNVFGYNSLLDPCFIAWVLQYLHQTVSNQPRLFRPGNLMRTMTLCSI